jgi:hypothetical protein
VEIGDRPLFSDFVTSTLMVFASTAAVAHGSGLQTVRPSAGAFGVLARWPSGLARRHAASEHGSDLLLKARRAENESAIGYRADLVDNALVQRLPERGPIGFAARLRAAVEPHVLLVRAAGAGIAGGLIRSGPGQATGAGGGLRPLARRACRSCFGS